MESKATTKNTRTIFIRNAIEHQQSVYSKRTNISIFSTISSLCVFCSEAKKRRIDVSVVADIKPNADNKGKRTLLIRRFSSENGFTSNEWEND